MNRPRKRDRHLPACMYLKHGAYYLVRHGKWLRLSSDLPGALREYARILGQQSGGMPDLIDTMLPRILRHKNSGKPKADETVRQYTHCAGLLRTMLGNLSPSEITPRDIKALRRELQDTPAIANRAITVLSLILAEAVEDELIDTNPAIGIDRIKLPARTRRITTAEYDSIYANADPLLRAVMSMCYATGQRVMDVCTIKTEQITEDGISFVQQKTKSRVLVQWTTALVEAVAEARALKPNALRPTHLWGFAPVTYPMVYKRWKKACKAARVTDANIHDMRAMSGTDADAQGIDAQTLLGHTDRRTTRIYLRDKTTPTVRGPVMKRPKSA
jgi:integrase